MFDFLKRSLLLTALLLACAQPLAAQPGSPALSVMVGNTEMNEAWIWVQTPQSAQVKVLFQAEGTSQSQQTGVYQTLEKDYFSVKIPLTGLKPETHYLYQIEINGKLQTLPYAARFRTQPLWRNRKAPPALKLALGSCAYLNDPEADIPGYEGLGGNYEIFESIRKAQPDFMLWMGDNVYLREPDFFSADRLNKRYRQMRELPEARPFLAAIPQYAIWDDHDYGSNDSDRSYRLRTEILDIFRHYWPNPASGQLEGGIYTRFEWGDAEFFLTDNRYFRAPFKLKDPNKDFFGPAQWAWLKDSLSNSVATFKFIVVGNQVLNTQTPSENFYSYRREFQDFLNWLEQSNIPGIVLLSGDRHHAELLKLERPKTYPLYEYTVSPLTSKAYPPFAEEKELATREPGSLIEARNFGLIQITGPAGQRVLELQTHASDGKILWQRKITQQELTPLP